MKKRIVIALAGIGIFASCGKEVILSSKIENDPVIGAFEKPIPKGKSTVIGKVPMGRFWHMGVNVLKVAMNVEEIQGAF